MTRSIFIASPEGYSGKSLVALGLVDTFARAVETTGVFRPVTRSPEGDDSVVRLLLAQDGVELGYDAAIGVTYDAVHDDPDAALATIVDRYRAVERSCDAVVVVGSDYTDVAGPTELHFNARVAANLGAPVLLVVSGFGRSPAEIEQVADIATAEITESHASTIGIVANRCAPDQLGAVRDRLAALGLPAWALPEVALLSAPTLSDLVAALDGELLLGDEAHLGRDVEDTLVCGMNAEHVLERLEEGQLCIVAGDRPDVVITLATAHVADGFPSLAGIVVNGGFRPSDTVIGLVRGLGARLPVVLTDHGTYDAARIVGSVRGQLGRGSQRKIDTALGVFERHVDRQALLRDLDVNLAPLAPDSRFNEAKSAIKWLEAALVETPTIASPSGPFREAIEDGRTGSMRWNAL